MDLVEEFATNWDTLATPIRGRTDYRVLITTTHLVPYVSVYAQLTPVDGAVELIDIDITGPWPDPGWPDADQPAQSWAAGDAFGKVTTTRRFAWRPAGVALPARGAFSP
jgi:hypothetical protein